MPGALVLTVSAADRIGGDNLGGLRRSRYVAGGAIAAAPGASDFYTVAAAAAVGAVGTAFGAVFGGHSRASRGFGLVVSHSAAAAGAVVMAGEAVEAFGAG